MGSSKDDEDYWNSSEQHSFCFENNEEDNFFGFSKTGTARLRAGISNIDLSDDYLKTSDSQTNLKPLLSVISEKTLANILEADKMQNLPEGQSVTQPDITLRRILLGQPFSLEKYKSLASKTALLDAAIESVLFLTKTLKRSLFERLLMDRPGATQVYIRYLSTRLQTSELTDLLTMLGRSMDAAMRTLQIIIKNTPNPERLLQKLHNCYKTQFLALADCKETPFIQNYIKLLEWQKAVKDTGFTEALEMNSPVMECLRHACRDHWGASESSLWSPAMLLKQHTVSLRQYQKVALTTRAALQSWDDIDILLLTKGWLGSKKLQTYLPIEDIIKILHNNNAPTNILEKYLGYVDDVRQRLELAKRFQCHRIVVDILVLQGDRAALLEYKTMLHPQSEHCFYAENALRASTTKWKS
ncbi:spermatogenesis-defective protein 39 homolog isoform X2 [Cephus cinctus]|uniref:Spermatogenesis-defective protein 39 homolog isoform X2 n=1 Tax=Cephus cinctus TaxID=211228 RepID=A0AAJ7RE24_CEPCN|nr:spermatogenesis-defective protein 39 homolog isoform X2 [Cephus cinctus]